MSIKGFNLVSCEQSTGDNFTQHGNLLGAIYHAFEKLRTYLTELLSLLDGETFDCLLSAICAVNLLHNGIGVDDVYDLFDLYREHTNYIAYSFIDMFRVRLNIFDNDFLNTFEMNESGGEISLDIFYAPNFGRVSEVAVAVRPLNGSCFNNRIFDACRIQCHNIALSDGGKITGGLLTELATSGAGNDCLINSISLGIEGFSEGYTDSNLEALNGMHAVCGNPGLIRRSLGIPINEEIDYTMIPHIMKFLGCDLDDIPNIHIILICIYSNGIHANCNAKFQLISNNSHHAANETAIPIILRDHHYQAIKPSVPMSTSELVKALLKSYFNCNVDAKHYEIMSELTRERIQYLD